MSFRNWPVVTRSSIQVSGVALAAVVTTPIPNAAAVFTKVDMNLEYNDDTSLFTVAASVITINRTGRYDLSATCGLSMGGAPASAVMAILANGLAFTNPLARLQSYPVSTLLGTIDVQSYTIPAGTTIQLGAFQNSGVAVNTWHPGAGSFENSRLMIRAV